MRSRTVMTTPCLCLLLASVLVMGLAGGGCSTLEEHGNGSHARTSEQACEKTSFHHEATSGAIRVEATVSALAEDYFRKTLKALRIGEGPAKALSVLPHIEEGLDCGEYIVRFGARDFTVTPAFHRVTVREARTKVVTFAVTPKPASLTVNVNAPEAEIFDSTGKRLGTAGTSFEIPAFAVMTLLVRAGGYEERTQTLDGSKIEPGRRYRHQMMLERQIGPMRGVNTRIDDLALDLVWLEPGRFSMGRPVETRGIGGRTRQRGRMVSITRGFWMGRTEITQAQWHAVMGTKPSHFKGNDYPVESVSWHDCTMFCRKLTEREEQAERLPMGYVYRLPTEAEWEYTVRGGHLARDTEYSGGSDPNAVAWHFRNSSRRSQPVGMKTPNELGIYDMSGNVWEWVHDWYQDTFDDASVNDPFGPAAGWYRVRRGGSWFNDVSSCHVASRFKGVPDNASSLLGFRIVLAPEL